ncbi:unnamed protein product [Brugia timori]|uniref:NADH-ubiquinone oxidoreductase chain 1 n=1 Tax=Brugia timori TaxID=42155 RepID=A0A0R3R1Z3_9BILA|nr:unnamed protein product [Brugia timori]
MCIWFLNWISIQKKEFNKQSGTNHPSMVYRGNRELQILCISLCLFFIILLLGGTQCRIGPNKVGYSGVFQALFDGLKLLKKEQLFFIFFLVIFFIDAYLWFYFDDFFFGLLCLIFLFLCLLTILVGGKYSFIGGLRACAQSYSYEIAFSVYLLIFLLFNKRLCLSFILIDLHRAPFDLSECERELVRGFNVEYSSVDFASLFLGEYGNLFAYPRFRFDVLIYIFLSDFIICYLIFDIILFILYGIIEVWLFGIFGHQSVQSRFFFKFTVFFLTMFWFCGLVFPLFSPWASVVRTFTLAIDRLVIFFSHWLRLLMSGVALTLRISIIFLIGFFFLFFSLLFVVPIELFFAFLQISFGLYFYGNSFMFKLKRSIAV